MKRIAVLFVAFLMLVVSLDACSSDNPSQDPFLRTVKVTTPLKEPISGGASIESFSEAKPFQKQNDLFSKVK